MINDKELEEYIKKSRKIVNDVNNNITNISIDIKKLFKTLDKIV